VDIDGGEAHLKKGVPHDRNLGGKIARNCVKFHLFY